MAKPKKTGTALVRRRGLPAVNPHDISDITDIQKRRARKPKYFRNKARVVMEKHDLVERLGLIANGQIGEMHTVWDSNGEAHRIYTETPIREQRFAIMDLAKLGGLSQPDAEDGDTGPAIVIRLINDVP